MPIYEDRNLPDSGTIGYSQFDDPNPSFMDTLSASFRSENIIGSYLTQDSINANFGDVYRPDPNYNVYEDEDFKELVRQNPDDFVDAHNKNAAGAIAKRIDVESADRRTREASGWTGFLTDAVASVLDPTILIPGGSTVRAGRIGYSLAKSGASVGIAAGVGTAVQEVGLQSTQITRTAEESLSNIGGSVILGGLMGMGAAKFFSNAEWRSVGDKLAADLVQDATNPVEVSSEIVRRMQSVGAASVEDLTIDDLAIGGPRAAQVVANATAAVRLSPGTQLMLSPSAKVREITGRLVDQPIYTTMNMEGRTLGAGAENYVKLYTRGNLSAFLSDLAGSWKEARKNGFNGTRAEFYDRVSYAARRGDIDENEYVMKAAQSARSKIFDPLAQDAIGVKILPDDIKTTTATSYVSRLWNRAKLVGEEPRFAAIVKPWLKQQMKSIEPADGASPLLEMEFEQYINDTYQSIFNNLTGKGTGEIPEWIVPVTQGVLKERTFNIPDELIEDFLTNDIELIARRYVRQMGSEIELTRAFGRADMQDQIKEIREEYAELRNAAQTADERLKLDAREKRDITQLQAMRDQVRGTYRAAEEGSTWTRITRAALTWNYIRLLGGQLLSSLTDAVRVPAVHGVSEAMNSGMAVLKKNTQAIKISISDSSSLGTIGDRVLQSKIAEMAELNDPYAYGSRYERFLSNASNIFSKATGIAWWNDTMRTIASVSTQNRLLKNIIESGADYSKLDKYERAYMGYLGIDQSSAWRILEQYNRFGVQEEGIYAANVSSWDSDALRRIWGGALNKDVDRTIIIPGAGDIPLWAKTNTGRLVTQFKSFGLASNQRVLIAGLQERPQRLAGMMVFGTALGMMVSYLKLIERGDTEGANNLLENPGKWIADGLDRTGILSLPFEASNTAEKLGLPDISSGISRLVGDKDSSGSVTRYASRGPLGAVLGPTAGAFEDFVQIANQLSSGDLKKSGVNAAFRQVPGATLPGVRSAIHVGIKPAITDSIE